MIPYDGDDAWVEGTLAAIHNTLGASAAPAPAPATDCEYCAFAARAALPQAG